MRGMVSPKRKQAAIYEYCYRDLDLNKRIEALNNQLLEQWKAKFGIPGALRTPEEMLIDLILALKDNDQRKGIVLIYSSLVQSIEERNAGRRCMEAMRVM